MFVKRRTAVAGRPHRFSTLHHRDLSSSPLPPPSSAICFQLEHSTTYQRPTGSGGRTYNASMVGLQRTRVAVPNALLQLPLSAVSVFLSLHHVVSVPGRLSIPQTSCLSSWQEMWTADLSFWREGRRLSCARTLFRRIFTVACTCCLLTGG